MKYMTSKEIRQMWLDFFKSKGHEVEESVSLIPNNDKSLLWINAGVAALKDYFDGSKTPLNKRMTNSQKCIRTNDIENVGMTARHHTLFEMLGNFSIGDYFKDEAIEFAIELLTSDKWFNFDKDLLYMTIYPGDNETKNKWISVGVDESHIIETYNNFWEIGPGPCGPCTEIFFDRGEKYGNGGIDLIRDDIENDRYIEIWNIVFSQFNSTEGLSRENYPELPQKNIDTGAGLERLTCVIQQTETNFETDLFMPIIREVEKASGVEYEGQASFKIIADHLRGVSFALSDGAMLSNEGRGYVLRRVLRRAVKHYLSLGIHEPFMYKIVDTLCESMGSIYPNLVSKKEIIKNIIFKEEEKFLETLQSGMKLIESLELKEIDGETAFKLYDTYGFPIELTLEYAEDNGLTVDVESFKLHMERQKELARSSRTQTTTMNSQNQEYLDFKENTTFVGYEKLTEKSKIVKVFNSGIVVENTPFYATSGGQAADQGIIIHNNLEYFVLDVEKLPHGQFLHVLENTHGMNEGDLVELHVDEKTRKETAVNHTTTHVLFSVLRKQLGDHVSQSGSQVTDKSLRFDFTNYSTLTDEDILNIEKEVKSLINKNVSVVTVEMTIDKAKSLGAIAEFGEKYTNDVRVVNIDGVTIDLCAGTHLTNLESVKEFLILSFESKGSGIFRIEALTNEQTNKLDSYLTNYNKDIQNVINKGIELVEQAKNKGINLDFNYKINTNYLKSYQDIINKRNELHLVQELVKELDKKIKKESSTVSHSDLDTYMSSLNDGVIVTKVENVDQDKLKTIIDLLAEKDGVDFVFVANVTNNEKITFVSKSNIDKYNCGKLVKEAAIITGGNGGGKPNMASAGGKDVSKIEEALSKVRELI